VQHLETALKYRCRLDLYEEKQTRKEAREAGEKLELRSDLIENDLSVLCDLLEEEREKQLTQTAREDPKKEKPVPAHWQAKCKKILLSKTLMQDLLKTIKQAGVIGEEQNVLMLFCSAFSFKMPETLHVIIQGSSGSGKTTLLSKTASFMPGERVIKFTRVTEGSFYNYDEYFFVGMYVCFEDLDGLKPEALLAVRELISNEILVSSTTWKDENGNLSGKPKTVRGPMASVSATTNGDLYEDNESRVFVIAVDESREQTKRIIQHQQKKAANIIDDEKEKAATELLQNLVRMLKPYKVLNPYAGKVQLPEHAQKLRRLSRLFLALVKQVTLLHQYQRKKTPDGRLIATKEDIKNAIELLFDTIVLKTDELDGSLRQFFEQLKAWVRKQGPVPEKFEFMRRDIRQGLHISNTQLHRFMNKLTDLEYIQEIGGYNNRGLKYKIIWWDDYHALRSRLKKGLLSQLETLPDEITDF
jgi:energy-coupling factor transporter ATP-binding protein EcfA2